MSVRSALATLLFLGAIAGCSADPSDAERTPALGASPPTASSPPATPMDDVEQPVADRLAGPLREDGLRLEHVTCPPWAGVLPAELECQGYVDGVVGTVQVRLTRGESGDVEFDAWLQQGVVATQKLVDRLVAAGASEADCGETPAYPAQVGLRLVCRVLEEDVESYVVATVTDRAGEVRIEDY